MMNPVTTTGSATSLTPPRVLVADDHHLILDSLRVMMKPRFDVIGVDNCQEFIRAVDGFKPDLALVDVRIPNEDGFFAVKRALERQPSLPVMFLSTYNQPEYISRAVEVGARGYLSKRIPGQQLMAAITSVLEGNTCFDATEKESEKDQAPDSSFLTNRQRQVLTLIARGGSAKDIANGLEISVRTAEFHRAAIMQRLSLHSTAQLTRYALSNNLG